MEKVLTLHLIKNEVLNISDKYQDYSDQQLLSSFYKTKDNEWLGVLFPRYTLLIFGVCMKYLKDEQNAKDATQQIFVKCIDELQKYPVEYFKSWVYMITKNYCLMQLRHHPSKKAINIDDVSYSIKDESKSSDIEELKEKEVTLELMVSSLAELTIEQQQCVTLFYLEKKSYQEIAEHLNINYMQVKSAIQNGKRNLKIIVQKKLNKAI
jgi:RNA polymerase sigma factor (sigma-70 family)